MKKCSGRLCLCAHGESTLCFSESHSAARSRLRLTRSRLYRVFSFLSEVKERFKRSCSFESRDVEFDVQLEVQSSQTETQLSTVGLEPNPSVSAASSLNRLPKLKPRCTAETPTPGASAIVYSIPSFAWRSLLCLPTCPKLKPL